MEHRPLVKVRLYMDVLLSLRGVPGIGVPPIMREIRVRLFLQKKAHNNKGERNEQRTNPEHLRL